ncbi:aspartate carbamoyltransferase regulatory subunit [Candidatus Woesearchaeota archaeon]|nr:aspartate carbamoyltransferase regulatory subunit [Candidatus Woesearchaeota archaeon]
MKQITVKALDNGTVIDHIPADEIFKVVEILNLKEEFMVLGTNFSSKKMGRKGIIKIADKELNENELNKLALVTPNATINVIKDGEVKEKKQVKLPEKVENLVQCGNAGCITRFENVSTKFHVVAKNPVTLKCHFCEKTFMRNELVLR